MRPESNPEPRPQATPDPELSCVLSLLKASNVGNTKKVAQLLHDGAAVHASEALIWAAGSNHVNTMMLLVKAGADVNMRDDRGMSPLYYALNQEISASEHRRQDIAQIVALLREAGAQELQPHEL